MKTSIYHLFFIGLLSMFIVSCSQKPEDIKLSDLKTPCDYLSAVEKVFDAALAISENNKAKDFDDYNENDKKNIRELKNKAKEIGQAFDKKYTEAEAKECDSYERVKKKGRSLRF